MVKGMYDNVIMPGCILLKYNRTRSLHQYLCARPFLYIYNRKPNDLRKKWKIVKEALKLIFQCVAYTAVNILFVVVCFLI